MSGTEDSRSPLLPLYQRTSNRNANVHKALRLRWFVAPEDRLHSSLPPQMTTVWTLQWLEWLQRQWEKAVEEHRRRRRRRQWSAILRSANFMSRTILHFWSAIFSSAYFISPIFRTIWSVVFRSANFRSAIFRAPNIFNVSMSMFNNVWQIVVA